MARSKLWLLLLALLLVTITGGLLERTAPVATEPDLSDYPWFYLRNGRAPAAGEGSVELLLVGDVMPGRGLVDVSQPLVEVASLLHAAHITAGNLEAVIASSGSPRRAPPGMSQPYLLLAPPAAAEQLAAAGFDVLGLANNHSLDYGPRALAETGWRLRAAGVSVLGADAYEPMIFQRDGVRLAFFAFNMVPVPQVQGTADVPVWDEARALQVVAAAKHEADAVIVSLHWGHEYQLQAAPWQRAVARALLDSGADLLFGHHPHVVQEVEVVEGERTSLVAYSLGNFLFDQQSPQTSQGLALRVFLDGSGLRALQALPVKSGSRPRLMGPAEAEGLLARIRPAPERLGFSCSVEGCAPTDGALTEETSSTGGPFWSGAIDLTGDGVDEIVRRSAAQVTIYEGDRTVWQSPPGWRVVDVALGDPNDDGRGELLLALWRADAEGYERSQPYILGYRGGAYEVIWGGRPVATPIAEVELGDVDGDGTEELVVLEALGEEQRVGVWRWQGWSFSLVWRSARGAYGDLRLARTKGESLLITVASETVTGSDLARTLRRGGP